VIIHPRSGKRLERWGGMAYTTNNQMELMGAIQALEALNRPCRVRLYSDSKYVVRAFTKGWISGWKRNGWRNSQGKPVSNKEFWLRLCEAKKGHDVVWFWVKGHAGDLNNERADELALLGRRIITGAIE